MSLVLGFPADWQAVLVFRALGAEHAQLLLQLADRLLVHLDLLLAILYLLLTDAKHVFRVELRVGIGLDLGGLALKGPLNDTVQVFDSVSQLQIDLLQSLYIMIYDALLLVIVVVFHLVVTILSLGSVHLPYSISYLLIMLHDCLTIVYSGPSSTLATISTANGTIGDPSELIFLFFLRVVRPLNLTSVHILLVLLLITSLKKVILSF